MAFTNVLVTAGRAGAAGIGGAPQPVFRIGSWSEAPASGVPTAGAAQAPRVGRGEAIMRVHATLDVYVAIGKNPDPTQSPRALIKGDGYPNDFVCDEGDRLAWVAA